MGKSEIVMILAGIIMTLLLGLAVAPSVGKSTDTSKYAVVNSELNNIRNASALWLGQNSSDGTYTGVTATGIQTFLPSLTLNGSGELVSRANSGVSYVVAPKTGDSSQLEVTAKGLTTISGAETSVKTQQTSIAATITDTTANDGILVFDYKG